MPNKSKLTDKDRTQEQIESLLKPVRLKDLEGGPETWNTASNAEALYRIFNVKQYVVDEDYILDPYTSNRPQSLAYRISDIIKHSDEHFRKRCVNSQGSCSTHIYSTCSPISLGHYTELAVYQVF